MAEQRMPITRVIEFLQKFPNDYFVRAYTGEMEGIVVENNKLEDTAVIHNSGEIEALDRDSYRIISKWLS